MQLQILDSDQVRLNPRSFKGTTLPPPQQPTFCRQDQLTTATLLYHYRHHLGTTAMSASVILPLQPPFLVRLATSANS